MRVLYDSHVLISAFLKESALHKTGVFRFAEQLALHLQQDKGCLLNLFSSLNAEELLVWKEKMEQEKSFHNFSCTNIYSPLKKKLDALSKQVKQSSFAQKVWLKSYRELLRLMSLKERSLSSQIEPFDLFYSPYHPAPKWIREHSKVPIVHTIHDLIPLKYPKFFQVNKKSFFDHMLKKARDRHFFFALSESTKADICHYYSISPKRIFIVHSCPKKHLFYPVQDSEILTKIQTRYQIKAPYFLSLATLEPRKNIPFLVDAFIELIESEPNFTGQLVLAGAKGWGFESILQKMKPYQDRIILTGFVEDQDLAALYSGAQAFVYPSLYEGFGLPPLEAMCCKTPVIVSNRSSLPEVVKKAGLYVDPTSKTSLCSALLKMSQDSKLREELSQKAYERSKAFSWEKNAQKALEAFQTILS